MKEAMHKALIRLWLKDDLMAAFSYVEEAKDLSVTERNALLDILRAGDLPGIARYVRDAACAPREQLKPRRAKFGVHPKHLAVAPCGCTLYPDTARQCAACIAARSPEACRALIAAHEPALAAFDQSQGIGFRGYGAGRSYRSPRSRDFMINPHNGYYGLRDKVEVA